MKQYSEMMLTPEGQMVLTASEKERLQMLFKTPESVAIEQRNWRDKAPDGGRKSSPGVAVTDYKKSMRAVFSK